MGLSRLALRIITCRALTGATIAGASVHDSAVDTIDQMVKAQRKPFITVSTDEHRRTITGRDLRHGDDQCELVLDVAVASKVTADAGGEIIVIPQTDAGMEVILDLIGQQINEALLSGATVWSRLWQDFAVRVVSVASRRGASAEDGTRFAARQIVITADILGDPVRGSVPFGPWQRLLAAMDADAELADMGALIRYAIEGDVPLTEEAMVASLYGISEETVGALGMAAVRDAEGAAVPVDEIILDQEGLPDIVLTEQAADEQGV